MQHLNSLVTMLNMMDPTWYLPWASLMAVAIQHWIDKVQTLRKTKNVLLSFLLAFAFGGVYAVTQVHEFNDLLNLAGQWLATTFVVGSPIYLLGQAWFWTVFNKLKQLNKMTTQDTPADDEAKTVAKKVRVSASEPAGDFPY